MDRDINHITACKKISTDRIAISVYYYFAITQNVKD